MFSRLTLVAVLGTAACRQDMHDQPRYEPLEASTLFADGRASRPLVEGTIPRGHLRLDDHLYAGKVDGKPAATFPFEVTRDVLERGEQRYQIFCAPCHDSAGTGQGMVVRRGFRQPTSYHIDRLRQAPPGYFVDVMSNGYGAMYSYASRVPAHDRWAIAAWIRVLQLSHNATPADVPPAHRRELDRSQP